ncbi:hypothetical protein KFL_003850010 [Klebsormidium nitens]|uniref:RRM domain-containing protein n=1 Tax=Klebsormidium nitens TaxID=105231 RepID=A0A1Y1IAC9_KLENI|nr:hypothetical protein KFL_003850010 [Klebsormidium nitens]|eukprot:GAQ87880.1 hypothetical protein KFL_003850010 [Klebsormidium nitens]
MYVESMEGGASDLVAEMERVSVSDRDLSGSPQIASTSASESKQDEIRTIFVLGFPRDMKERELHNLLRWWPGYVACQLTQGSGDQQAMGFALFETAAMATAAKDALQNLVFDGETNSVLRAEMAKKNLYVRKGREGGNDVQSDLRRIRGGGEARRSGGEPRKPSTSGQDQAGGQGGVGPYNWPNNQGGGTLRPRTQPSCATPMQPSSV